LTSIAGYVELLQEEEEDSEKLGHLAIVGRNSERLLALVTDLLFAARLQYGRLELERSPVDLRSLVVQCVESARPRAQATSVQLDLEVEDVPETIGEPAKLAQLLDNLVSNAIKFTPRDGHVSVRLTSHPELIRIEVSDTGIGIPDQERERLFERFFRAQSALERQIQGTGLGLYISKAIVDAHDGRIGVDSAPGEGTTFTVRLPDVSGVAVVGERLLVVEDERRDADLIVALASAQGIRCEVVSTLAAAIASFESERPLGIVLDLRLPDGRGEAILALAAAGQRPNVPVVVVSIDDDLGRSRSLGADDHITKPIDHARMSAWLAQIAARRAARSATLVRIA